MRRSWITKGCLIVLISIIAAWPIADVGIAATEHLAPCKDGFPRQPIRLLSHLAPGSDADAYLRALAEASKPYSPVPLLVEDLVSPKGVWGQLKHISEQKGGEEGYFVPVISGGHIVRAIRLDIRPYSMTDVRGVIITHYDPVVFAVKSDAKWKTLKDLLDEAKASPGRVRIIAGGSAGGGDHSVAVLLETAAKVKFTIIPSPGSGQATLTLLGGGAEAGSFTLGGPSAYLKSGELRGLAMALPTKKRDPAWPNIPSFKEQGIDVGFPYPWGLVVPKTVPNEHVKWLFELFNKGAVTANFKKFIEAKGYAVTIRTPEVVDKEIQETYKTLEPVLDALGLKFKPQG